MNARKLFVGLLAIGLSLTLSARLLSDDKKPDDKPKMADEPAEKGGMPSPAEMAEMMKKWEDSMKPGKPHEKLAKLAGDWTTTTKMFMMPGVPPIETKGTAKFEVIYGGRFLHQTTKGEMKMPDMTGGMKTIPHEGHGDIGYDNVKNLYTATWIDNQSTQVLTMSGTADPSGKTITMYGQMDEPTMNMYGRMVKYVHKFAGKDKFTFEIYDLAAGDNYKVLEVEYVRKS